MRAAQLLVLSSHSAGLNSEIEARLREEFPDYTTVRFGAVKRIQSLVTANAKVVVAGGDGTVGAVVRRLAGTRCRIGIIPLGTFNNFAMSLRVPAALDKAIDVAKRGRARSITLGHVNGVVFLEACAVGLFGETIRLGESAKDRKLRGITAKIRRVLTARPFRYELSKDLVGSGTAMSLVFSNTYSTGIQLPLGDSTHRQHRNDEAYRHGTGPECHPLHAPLSGCNPHALRVEPRRHEESATKINEAHEEEPFVIFVSFVANPSRSSWPVSRARRGVRSRNRHSRNGSNRSSFSGTSACARISNRAQAFQRRSASSFPGGRTASAAS